MMPKFPTTMEAYGKHPPLVLHCKNCHELLAILPLFLLPPHYQWDSQAQITSRRDTYLMCHEYMRRSDMVALSCQSIGTLTSMTSFGSFPFKTPTPFDQASPHCRSPDCTLRFQQTCEEPGTKLCHVSRGVSIATAHSLTKCDQRFLVHPYIQDRKNI